MKVNDYTIFLKNTFILIGLLFLSGIKIYAQNITVEAILEKDNMLIGDQLVLNIKLLKPVNEIVEFPVFTEKLTDTIEIISQSKTDTTDLNNGSVLIQKNLLITAFDSGFYKIPPIAFLHESENSTDTLTTKPLWLKVNTVQLDTTNVIKDIKAPYHAPISFYEILPWALGFIGLAIIVFVIIYIIRKIKRKEPIFRRLKPLEPAHIIALRDLEKLKNDKLWQSEKIKDYYTRLTDILRVYLWNRYAIRTLERTSDEILQSLKISDFNDEKSFTLLKDIFKTSDLVKFAKFKPLQDENEKCLNGAYEFVDRTKLIIIEENEAGEEPVNMNNNIQIKN
ncbi:MAG: hypothetical protein A2X13_08300 [Bacteroidetes bacterium GWC2_33_15]|nr:MAG: hypothetical protein A2X10_10130 [Bacteroidetes bacterium GWA2_33_15]OFX51456.1 MAG: hypothetical protein A2X13_08300 [Bacteroidetes bacterium GWC2_33_15]OFX65798.1 MAG: hypothetical protein A2X15_13480 [Bacteroidetes bacterium GWB2_32_14]OFX69484.1 MAG: hypothetical protein A2X14_09880 [Bacteroidetes bacterium GWD2_33_33]HAN17740.1 hypothetical protein [Bacteroidales bacterium]